MDAVGAGQARDVRTVVDDELGAGGVSAPHDIVGQREVCLARQRLVAQLQQPRTTAQTGVGERPRIDSVEPADGDVDDRIERAQTASASPALLLFF